MLWVPTSGICVYLYLPVSLSNLGNSVLISVMDPRSAIDISVYSTSSLLFRWIGNSQSPLYGTRNEANSKFSKIISTLQNLQQKLYASIMLDIHLAILLGYQTEFYKHLIIKLKINIKS